MAFSLFGSKKSAAPQDDAVAAPTMTDASTPPQAPLVTDLTAAPAPMTPPVIPEMPEIDLSSIIEDDASTDPAITPDTQNVLTPSVAIPAPPVPQTEEAISEPTSTQIDDISLESVSGSGVVNPETVQPSLEALSDLPKLTADEPVATATPAPLELSPPAEEPDSILLEDESPTPATNTDSPPSSEEVLDGSFSDEAEAKIKMILEEDIEAKAADITKQENALAEAHASLKKEQEQLAERQAALETYRKEVEAKELALASERKELQAQRTHMTKIIQEL